MEDGAISYALDIVELWDILLLYSNYDRYSSDGL